MCWMTGVLLWSSCSHKGIPPHSCWCWLCWCPDLYSEASLCDTDPPAHPGTSYRERCRRLHPSMLQPGILHPLKAEWPILCRKHIVPPLTRWMRLFLLFHLCRFNRLILSTYKAHWRYKWSAFSDWWIFDLHDDSLKTSLTLDWSIVHSPPANPAQPRRHLNFCVAVNGAWGKSITRKTTHPVEEAKRRLANKEKQHQPRLK